jgi:hypothetical protein
MKLPDNKTFFPLNEPTESKLIPRELILNFKKNRPLYGLLYLDMKLTKMSNINNVIQ